MSYGLYIPSPFFEILMPMLQFLLSSYRKSDSDFLSHCHLKNCTSIWKNIYSSYERLCILMPTSWKVRLFYGRTCSETDQKDYKTKK